MGEIETLRRAFRGMDETAYFQWAYRSLLPESTLTTIQEVLQHHAEVGADARPEWFETHARLRRKLAAWHASNLDNTMFMPNTSWGMSLIANGFNWEAERERLGAAPEVLIPQGEFPANVYPWMNLERQGVRLRVVPSDAQGRVRAEALLQAISRQTVLVAASHVSFQTGYRLDIKTLAQGCRERGVFCVVDGAQSSGWAVIDFDAIGCDVFTGVARKFWCALDGLDFFFTSKRIREVLTPSAPGPFSVKHDSDYLRHELDWRDDATKFANGAIATLSAYALEASFDLLFRIGKKAVEARALGLATQLREGLRKLGIGFDGEGWEEPEFSPILRVNEVRDHWPKALEAAKVSVSIRSGGMRVSLHAVNNESDIKRLLTALR